MSFVINVLSKHSVEQITADTPMMGHEVLTLAGVGDMGRVMAWRVNRILRPLGWVIDEEADVEFVDMSTIEGIEIYERTLTFVMALACKRALSKGVIVRYSMGSSFYCELSGGDASPGDVEAIRDEMERLVSMALPIQMAILPRDKAHRIFGRQGDVDKARLMQWTGMDPITVYRCAGMCGYFGAPLAASTAMVKAFDLTGYAPGFLLRFPSITDVDTVPPLQVVPKLMDVFREYSTWLSVLGLSTMDSLHDRVSNDQSLDLILLSEAFHSETLSRIAHEIIDRKNVRLVCLAGPSSSGKTTTSRRLAIQLQVYGKNPVTLALDNYYVDRDETPRDENGNFDFEALEALDVQLINKNLEDLLDGKEIILPSFDFVSGTRKPGRRLRLRENDILIIEGIHGLNDKITANIAPEAKYRVFISPLTGVSLDTYNRIGSTDVRLLRRIVRDHRTRGHSPEVTLMMWPSVVKGSHKHIFPYEEGADILFNTSLVYEIAVIKGYAEPLLRAIHESSPSYGEARRLLSMLSFAPVIPSENVPNLSILREFIGGSCFDD
ncbi:MAG: nucleoside kinase [Synergistaceae bacterium]|jgi:uridine kinase|nr:nucleoside kinase [Synergistaceae bacterium]